jgi:gluconate 2-dehydrogenase gamma chain
MTRRPTRRDVLFIASALPAAAWAFPVVGQPQPVTRLPTAPAAPSSSTYAFLNEAEARFLLAAVDRLIPPDETWPGASWAGVVTYIDRQLAGPYGDGYRLYLEGPFDPGAPPEQGYQHPYTPAQLYRRALSDLSSLVPERHGGRPFWDLSAEEQDAFLRGLESSEVELPSTPGAVFFETLLANTIEGFLSDPVHGGNRDMVGWQMMGFPGAYASYVELVDHHGVVHDPQPISIADATHAHPHDHGVTDSLDRSRPASPQMRPQTIQR